MFGVLKKKLKESIKQLAGMAEGKEEAKPRHEAAARPEKELKRPLKVFEKVEAAGKKDEKPKPKGIFSKIREKEFSESEIDEFFDSVETGLLQANIALEVMDFFRTRLKQMLVGKPVKRSGAEKLISDSFRELLFEIVNQKKIDIFDVIKSAKKQKRPACFLFLGYNGSGKTTTIAKMANQLMKKKLRPVLAAADTFRAASIEQLDFHGGKLGINVIKHNYGADPAAVVFDARKHAESRGLDVVLADTAGRMHTNVNLMDELKKVVRVNKPDLKILVVDSLTGNDVVQQVKMFNDGVGIDGIVMTKTDVNEKGGSIISACYVSKKPVLFIGTGQKYEDLQEFEPEKFVDQLLE